MPDQLFETFLTSRGFKGLCQRGCHILVKNWIFDDPFHKKLSVLVILVPVMIRQSKSESRFWQNWASEAVETSEDAEVVEVNEAGEVYNALQITSVDLRVSQNLEFNNFRTNITLF